jgi:hypothetical protein
MEFNGVRVDGMLWIYEGYEWVPICPKHYLRLRLAFNSNSLSEYECAQDRENFRIHREFNEQKKYIQNKLDAKDIQKRKFLNIDGESVAFADAKANSDDGKYFVTAILTESKVGLRLVVYAGEKGKEKTQIFIEPAIKRLAFDQTNTHPSEVFVKLEGTFDDGSSASINQAGK